MKNKLLYAVSLFLIISCEEAGDGRPASGTDEVYVTVESALLSVQGQLETKIERMNTPAAKDRGGFAIEFMIVKNDRTGDIALANFKTVSGLLPLHGLFSSGRSNSDPDEYEVSCSGGSGGDWSKSCGGMGSCGSLAIKCLDQGGCAEVCSASYDQIALNREDFFGLEEEAIGIEDFLNDKDTYSATNMFYYPSPF